MVLSAAVVLAPRTGGATNYYSIGDTESVACASLVNAGYYCTLDQATNMVICCPNPPSTALCDTIAPGDCTGLGGAQAGDTTYVGYPNPNGHLDVARKIASGSWSVEVADPGPGRVGQFPSLAVAPGHVYVSYYDSTNGNLKLASRSPGGVWTQQVVDSTGNVGAYTSLHFDSGVFQLSYADLTHGDLKFATRSLTCLPICGPDWTIQTIDSVGSVGAYTSLVSAGANCAISYFDQTRKDLKVARRIGGVWSAQPVDTAGFVGEFSSMVRLGSQAGDSLEIAYYDRSNGNLKIARRFGSWTLYPIDVVGDVGSATSIGSTGIQPTDSVMVVYGNVTNNTMSEFVHPVLGLLQVVSVPPRTTASETWLRCSLDLSGVVHIQYRVARRGSYVISFHDLQGRRVAPPFRRILEPGVFENTWAPGPAEAASGVYFVELKGPGVRLAQPAVLLR